MEISAIQTCGLTRRFGELTAVDNVTFSVTQGQFFGFLGPNGAGKSTTIKMLTGLLEPSAGSIEILGQPFGASALELKRQIGVVPEKLALAAAVIHGPKILFLDEPFEGVDAIAAGMLKVMLQGMIQRGATIFLTSHVLEIVERLCSHVAIIHQGRLVANGSIEDLRSGVASTLPGAESSQRLTLEEIFLSIVGATNNEPTQELSWLT